jgi:hypothetical protein
MPWKYAVEIQDVPRWGKLETREPERPLGPRRRGAAFSTQPLGLRLRLRRGGDAARTLARAEPDGNPNTQKQ